jgi:hypothetical protein
MPSVANRSRGLISAVLSLGLSGLATGPVLASTAYVVLGEQGQPVVRVLTENSVCPNVRVDGHVVPMMVRRGPGTVAQRPTASTPENSQASVFPVLTCELALSPRVRSATVDGHRLPLPRRRLDRIVVIGDTGCRLKAADAAYQACNDPSAFPFARIAAEAAAWHPDAVIHVGDLIYRENPCPAGNDDCAGSPWGYGYDAWRADFFEPAAPLLSAAPWILTRGNHESCARAGQGWWRFLDPRPIRPDQTCDDPANDAAGDYSPPFAVPLGGGAQVAVLDLSGVGGKAFAAGDPRIVQLNAAFADLGRLARGADFTFAIDHYPILGVSAAEAGGVTALQPGNAAIQSVFADLAPRGLPDGVDVLLAGHVHLWEQVSFSTDHPSQFIAGFSGTLEDTVPLPDSLPAGTGAGMGSVASAFSSWVDGFGYMTMERRGPQTWAVTVRDVDGGIVNRCRIHGRHSSCQVASVRTSSTR